MKRAVPRPKKASVRVGSPVGHAVPPPDRFGGAVGGGAVHKVEFSLFVDGDVTGNTVVPAPGGDGGLDAGTEVGEPIIPIHLRVSGVGIVRVF